LVCRIQKKGGDWERQYLIAESDVQIENLSDEKNWLGVREYQRQLEGAGLSQSIRHVLALEQGATDKLCDKKPTELLKLVFDAYGEQEIRSRLNSGKWKDCGSCWGSLTEPSSKKLRDCKIITVTFAKHVLHSVHGYF